MILTFVLPSETKERKNGRQKKTNLHCYSRVSTVVLKKVLPVNHRIQWD